MTSEPVDDEIHDRGGLASPHGVEPVVVGPVEELLKRWSAADYLVTDGLVDPIWYKRSFD